MKRLNYLFSLGVISLMIFGFIACNDDDDNTPAMEYNFSVALWSEATTMIEENIMGDARGAGGHAGPVSLSLDSAVRDVYTNMSDPNGTAQPGDIIVKFTYDSEGSVETKATTPSIAFAMIKQEAGINDEFGNWKWYLVPYVDGEPNVDGVTQEPQPNCYSCHSNNSSSDYRFVGVN